MAYLTQTILENLVGTAKFAALTASTAARVTQTIASATAETEAALQVGGYTGAVPATVYDSTASNCPEIIKLAAFGSWLELTYGALDLTLPEEYRAYTQKLDDLRSGKLEIPSVSRSVQRSVGGVGFTESDPDVTDSRPQVFSRNNFRDGGY